MNKEIFPKNAFDGIFNPDSKVLNQIKSNIKNGRLDEAISLINEYFDDENPSKEYYLSLIDEKILSIEEEETEVTGGPHDGTDISNYLILDEKLKNGTINSQEKLHLYKFWSAYPKDKGVNYCLDMFKWVIDNEGACCSDLCFYIIDHLQDKEIACFYFVLSREKGYLSEVRHSIEYYEEYFGFKLLNKIEIEYKEYCKNKIIPTMYLLDAHII